MVFLCTAIGCAPSDPLAKVEFIRAGDICVTAADTRDAVLLLAEIRRLSGHPVKETDFPKWANRTAMRIVPSLLSSAQLEREFQRIGLATTPEAEAIVLKRFQTQTRHPTNTLDQLAAAFRGSGKSFRRQFANESKMESYFLSNKDCQVTDEEVEVAEAQMRTAAKKTEQDNAAAKKRGEEAWKSLKAGEDWSVVARKYSEDKLLYGKDCNYDREWETFAPKNFYLKEVAEAVVGKKPGEFTRPVDTDEGLVIVKVVSVENDQYTCVRILIRLRYNVEIRSRKALKEELVWQKRKDAQLNLLRALREKVSIEYPLGTNFCYKIWEEPASSQK